MRLRYSVKYGWECEVWTPEGWACYCGKTCAEAIRKATNVDVD